MKMKYLIMKKQKGCRINYEIHEFKGNLKKAIKHFEKILSYPDGKNGCFAFEGEYGIHEVLVFPFKKQIMLNIGKVLARHRNKIREELKRLKKKI